VGSKSSAVTGYRYYFSQLMGLCRGPIDQITQIQVGGLVAFDGSPQVVAPTNESGYVDQEGDPSSNYIGGGIWNGGPVEVTSQNVPIQRPDLFGGDASQGGVVGSFDAYMGDADQTLGTRILGIMSSTNGLLMSAMRGVVTLFYDGEICANNPYPQPFTVRGARALKGWDNDDPWYPAVAVIPMTDLSIPAYDMTIAPEDGSTITITTSTGQTTNVFTSLYGEQTLTSYSPDGGTTTTTMAPISYNQIYAMNPAHIIYECCTDPYWGRGLDRALMDDTSFTSAANTLYAENFGMCLKWSRSDDIDTFVQEVVDTIGAVLYTNKFTGLMCIRLLRADYNAADLYVFDTDHGLLEVTTSNNGAQDAVPNEIIVRYNSPVLNNQQQARAQNIASINSLGAVYSQTKSYTGIPTSTQAILVAQRDLKALSAGYRSVTATVDRRGYLIVPGDVIIINKPDQRLNNFIMRVAQVEEADISTGTIKLTGSQDVYSIGTELQAMPQQSVFQEPNLYPSPVAVQVMVEKNYRDLVVDGTYSTLDPGPAMPTTGSDPQAGVGYLRMVAVSPSPMSYTYSLLIDGVDVGDLQDFNYGAMLTKAATTVDTTLYISNDTLNPRTVKAGQCILALTPGGLNEYLKINGVAQDSTGQSTLAVGRGCVDTIAVPLPIGTKLFVYEFGGTGAVGDVTPYGEHSTVSGQCLPNTSNGQLPAVSASYTTLVLNLRQQRPYSGANFRINGYPRDDMPLGTIGPDGVVATWSHRDRLLQQDQLVGETEADIGPEGGVIYGMTVFLADKITGAAIGQFNTVGDTPPAGWAAAAAANYGGGNLIPDNAYTVFQDGSTGATGRYSYGNSCIIRPEQAKLAGATDVCVASIQFYTSSHNGAAFSSPVVSFDFDPRCGWGYCFGHLWNGTST
jgi:hypothetical protein